MKTWDELRAVFDKQLVSLGDVNFAIVQAFRARNITIPFPQRDLHVRSAVPMHFSTSSPEDRREE